MDLIIDSYQPKHYQAFKSLNCQWIESHFESLDQADYKVLTNPNQEVIDKGGSILVALLGDVVVGVVALIPQEKHIELAKMAVAPQVRNSGIGQRLVAACIDEARSLGYKTMFLYTNRQKLHVAFHLYKKMGFSVQKTDSTQCRCDTYMEMEL